MLPVIYVLGGIGLRFVSKRLLQRAIAMGAKKAPKGFKGKVVAGTPKQLSNLRTVRTRGGKGRMPSSSSNAANVKGKRANPAARPSTDSKTSTNKGANAKPSKPPSKNSKTSTDKGSKANAAPKPSTNSKTSTNKGANAKPVKPLAKNSKTSNNKTSKANAAPKPSTTSKTSNTKGKGAKPVKPGSKTSKTSTSKGKQSNLPLIVGLGSGVAGAIMALGDKKPSKLAEGARTVKTREGKGSTKLPESSRTVKTREGKPAAGPTKDESFGAVFKRNRKANKATFTFKDKLYTTRIKEESIAEHKKKFGVKGKYK